LSIHTADVGLLFFIPSLSAHFLYVDFLAPDKKIPVCCNNPLTPVFVKRAINRVQQEQNIKVKLLPAAQVVPTAIGEAIQRQRQGWAYIRI